MKRFAGKVWICLLLSLAGSLAWGQSLQLPPSVCKLTAEAVIDHVESYPVPRISISGCLSMRGDPPGLFFPDANPAPGCAIQFYFDWNPEIKLQFRVYRDSGDTRFSDDVWNDIMLEALGQIKEAYWKVEKEFDGEERNGTPVLGFVSLDYLIRLEDPETEAVIRHRYCLVRVPEQDLVLLVGFYTPEKHFNSINREFERFVRGLHRRS
jgi:hypothetical protein